MVSSHTYETLQALPPGAKVRHEGMVWMKLQPDDHGYSAFVALLGGAETKHFSFLLGATDLS